LSNLPPLSRFLRKLLAQAVEEEKAVEATFKMLGG